MILRDGIWFPDSDTHFPATARAYQRQIYAAGMLRVRSPSSIAIDAGAHVGLFTRRMAVDFPLVLAFEPDPDNYACLVKNLAGADNTTLYFGALGAAPGQGSLRIDAAHNSGARGVVPGAEGGVRICTIDVAASGHKVGLVKIDTQGSEYDILLGAREVLARDRPVLIVEYPTEEIWRYLASFGYRPDIQVNKDLVFVPS